MQNQKKFKKIKTQLKQQVIHTNQLLWWGDTASQNPNRCTSRLLQNSVSIATSTLFTMVTPTLPSMDASGAWLTIVADNNDEGDDDDDRLRTDHVTQQLPQVAP